MPVSNNSPSRRVIATLALSLSLALGACAAPPSGAAGPTPVATTAARSEAATPPVAAATPTPAPVASQAIADTPKPRSKPAPPMSDPLPPERMPDAKPPPRAAAAAAATASLDVSCRSNADCAVKNVGSCCGIRPRCVNVNARVDAKAVQAQCAKDGRRSTCGFKPVESCECKLGECHDKPMLFDAQ